MRSDQKSASSFKTVNATSVLLAIAFFAALAAAAASIIYVLNQNAQDQQRRSLTQELETLSIQLTTLSREATEGQESAFGELATVLTRMQQNWDQIRNGNGSALGTAPDQLSTELSAYDSVWNGVKRNAQSIVQKKDSIIFLNDVADNLNQALPGLQQEHNNIVEILLENRAPAEQISVAEKQSWRAERIGRNVDKMLRGGADADEAADQFNLDASIFGRVLQGMREGNVAMGISRITDREAIGSLNEITELFAFVNNSVQEIFETAPQLFEARQALNSVVSSSPALLENLALLGERIEGLAAERPVNNITSGSFAAIALLIMIIYGILRYFTTQRSLVETERTNERNQNAILRLLDELADLADGDLTTTATVTEDFTGAIADSINFTIDQLRILVSRINETAVAVSSATDETRQTALHLAEAAEHQAQEIAGASAAVNEMAVTIDQVSANAAESAAVAERSVSIASNGAKVVQNTIHGMDTIREQIQDTSKRIKRLGESSQEIGDIVSLINDIADQTNILALNAAIQASMAGDAGRGFAVVADEVQRLAERSAAATKQIEALVKTIQNDTNEAVISMEQTTAEVVRGARLAQDAGVALEEIENVSTSLAELIQNISNAARQQASSAGHISNTMNVIQEITSQTSAGTSATAQSIGNLSEMALDLRDSVAGFKLPEEAGGEEGFDMDGRTLMTPALEDESDIDVESDFGDELDLSDLETATPHSKAAV